MYSYNNFYSNLSFENAQVISQEIKHPSHNALMTCRCFKKKFKVLIRNCFDINSVTNVEEKRQVWQALRQKMFRKTDDPVFDYFFSCRPLWILVTTSIYHHQLFEANHQTIQINKQNKGSHKWYIIKKANPHTEVWWKKSFFSLQVQQPWHQTLTDLLASK